MTDPQDNDGSELWDIRKQALEGLLGPSAESVFHSVHPLELGGDADVLEFPGFVPGASYTTADLTGPQSSQALNALGQYELMICTRKREDWAPSLISRLARYIFEATLEPSETMDISGVLPPDSTVAALLFAEPPVRHNDFQVMEQRCGLLLCLGITA